ncbi:YARHG domain-containing protein [Hymenobacter jeollabukensis]|uniref:YARHG domain-containing protein n=1 Tax=Hymenobacter jeollabukensis TaxID=2025313 RepID=A0A5R8WRC8_9BACT|nr:YARHG domain-containing protein [Hymenobacter jeollabukensis]TLM93307.1 YARHG domain-containing protein [Hymenobacter jeollabukensis]
MRPFFCLLLLLGLAWRPGSAQSTVAATELVDAKTVRAWTVKDAGSYAGVYHFGVSEAESNLILCVDAGLITAQIVSGHWSAKSQWIADYQNLRNVRVTGNKFAAEGLSGEFISYVDEEGQRTFGLRIRQPWSGSVGKGQWEVGSRSSDLPTYFDYPFGFVSYRLLKPAELQARSPAELALMRNELFARYGFIFAKGGAMDQHFRRFDWYRPQHRDISGFLTEIEKRNLELIRQQEART